MKLRLLSKTKSLKGKRVLVRVDWNIPLKGELRSESLLKVERSLGTLRDLSKRGARVVVLTHLGRPKGKEAAFSTRHLVPILKRYFGMTLIMHEERISHPRERARVHEALWTAKPGSIHLLENVRFEAGEEKNDSALAKAYAEIGDLFINDAFASCHRAHASVVGVAKMLPAYAGAALVAEVRALSRLIDQPRRPLVAVIGGKKLSTKIPVLQSLLRHCDYVLIGGAMATTFSAAKGQSVGRSFVDHDAFRMARRLGRDPKIALPIDVAVSTKLVGGRRKVVALDHIKQDEMVFDMGPQTLLAWNSVFRSAKTILWNGPVGVDEQEPWDRGSKALARLLAKRAAVASTFVVAGGGDTIPVIAATKTMKKFDYVSTGGGALLEFIAKNGKLPGLVGLMRK